jgi:ATP-dependent RNA circularization protein (DNA/RNA ligase family)
VKKAFFRFPHTPHIAWLGDGIPRDDKVLSPAEAKALLAHVIVVEEKLDGANMGISVSPQGTIRTQNRGQYLVEPHAGQFKELSVWLKPREEDLFEALGESLILFGEWCAARHSLAYDRLSDWFQVFDVYDRQAQRFWSSSRRKELANMLGLQVVPEVFRGKATLATLKELLENHPSAFRNGPMEGVVVRRESGDRLEERAKLVRPAFTQAIGEHWRSRKIEWNRLDWSHSSN